MGGLIQDVWLSTQLQRDCYNYQADPLSIGDIDKELGNLTGSRVFVAARIPCQETRLLFLYQQAKFRVVDTNLNFAKKVGEIRLLPFEIRRALPSDEPQVLAIAGSAYRFSRFHLDPHLTPQEAEQIKREWARNFFLGKRGDLMNVVIFDGRVTGFALAIMREGELIIDLIAVATAFQGKGLGDALLAALESEIGLAGIISAGTQAANVSAIRFYESHGFRLRSSNYLLHWHK